MTLHRKRRAPLPASSLFSSQSSSKSIRLDRMKKPSTRLKTLNTCAAAGSALVPAATHVTTGVSLAALRQGGASFTPRPCVRCSLDVPAQILKLI